VIILLAGRIAAGKSTLALELQALTDASIISTRQILAELSGISLTNRQDFQQFGAALDQRTAGKWLRDYVLSRGENSYLTIIDSVRTLKQAAAAIHDLNDARIIYVDASEATRRNRYISASLTDPIKAGIDFDAAAAHTIEIEAVGLRPLASTIVTTDGKEPFEVAELLACTLSLRPRR
jgi:predicted kinase